MRAVNFQDPAAQMKRAMFQAVAIGVVAVVLYMFCVEPSQTALQKAKTDLVGLQDKQAQMVRNLKGAGLVKERLATIKSQRQDYLNGLLHPMLESYAMRAKSLLDPLAEDVGLSVSDYAELPVRRLPLPKPQSPQLYARKPIRLTCTGSYATIVSFIMRVEQKLPLVSLEAFSLKTQKDPDNQAATIVLEWPIKGENTAVAAKGGVKK
jgi:Tfp pilus assembly protein PilO